MGAKASYVSWSPTSPCGCQLSRVSGVLQDREKKKHSAVLTRVGLGSLCACGVVRTGGGCVEAPVVMSCHSTLVNRRPSSPCEFPGVGAKRRCPVRSDCDRHSAACASSRPEKYAGERFYGLCDECR